MKIGTVNLQGCALLAPMAGVTDRSFRRLCMQFGAALCTTEMVSAKAMHFHDKKTAELMALAPDEHPCAIQLFGSEPDIMAEAAKAALQFNPQIIDINMGCPAPKITGNGCGSALMKDPNLCGKIVEAVTRSVKIPVTVKMRKGWDEQTVNCVEIAKICENAGASAVCVHGRTRMQMYQPSADWEIIKEVKNSVSIPVIGNGDVTDAQSACLLLEQTGCDFVMVGRAALGNPWIFTQIDSYLTDSCRIVPPPGIATRMKVMLRHIQMICEDKGEQIAMREARKHVGWYLHGVHGAADFRRRAGTLCTFEELEKLAFDVYAENRPLEEDNCF